MPLKISPPTIPLQQRERQLAEQFLSRSQQVRSTAPWQGVTPNLPREAPPFTAILDSRGLVARADGGAGGGEILINDGGFTRVDSGRLPLGSGTDTVVSILKDFPLVTDTTKEPSGDEATQGIAVISKQSLGTPNAGDSTVYMLRPSTTEWFAIAFTTGTGTAIAGDELGATVDGDALVSGGRPVANSIMSMVDAAVFTPGCPGSGDRQTLSTDIGTNGTINQPAFIFTNNYDPVMVYPRANSTLEYEPLTDQFGVAGNACDFRCVSVEAFADRMNFFNTVEGVGADRVRFRNRLRRSARGTADPDPAKVGAGSIDFDDFAGHGVKIKRLGNVLACYFQDGVAFVSETGQVAAPYATQNLDERRGLLGTHALVSISNNEHLGIFHDGWWVLDSAGRWRELGIVSIDGRPIEKWKTAFYNNLNRAVSHRLQLHYDSANNWVRMSVPTLDSDTDVLEVWIYDLNSDRVWKDYYPGGVSCWGDITMRESAALLWSTATQLWNTIGGSWQTHSSAVGEQRMCHGTEAGLVHFHQDNFITRDGADPIWTLETVPSDLGSPLSLKVADRVVVEHIDSDNASAITIETTTPSTATHSQAKILTESTTNNIIYAKSYPHLSNEQLGVRISGVGPVRIRGLTLDYQEPAVSEPEA